MTGLNDYLDYTKGGGYRKQQSRSQLGTYGSTQLHQDQFTAEKDFQYISQRPHWTLKFYISMTSNRPSPALRALPPCRSTLLPTSPQCSSTLSVPFLTGTLRLYAALKWRQRWIGSSVDHHHHHQTDSGHYLVTPG